MDREKCPSSEVAVRVTGHAGATPGNGPFMRIMLGVAGEVIREASYETYQCPACHDCGKAACGLAAGKTLPEARAIKHQDVVDRVGPLPQSRSACYGLAILALSDALDQLEGKTPPR